MDQTTLEALEYPSVLNELAGFCLTSLGKELVEELRPYTDISRIDTAFREFLELRDLVRSDGALSLASVTDTRALLSSTGPEGAFFLPEELLRVHDNIITASRIKAMPRQDYRLRYPLVSAMCDSLTDQRELARELNRILDEKGGIRDDASRELGRIRREIRSVKERTRALLDSFLKDQKLKEFLQEDIITIRDDRYVLSVKTGKHVEVPGIIHGRSGSGATYFIEPFEIVEINNRLSILKKEEKAEETEILKAATRSVLAQKDFLLSDLAVLARLDCLQAKTRFAEAVKGTAPELGSGGAVRFLKARHPLLAIGRGREAGSVVPVDIVIGEGVKVLVISGANTGGKTVALKTLGLLTLMAQSGIPVSADEGSTAMIYGSIFADIGDRQDIIASLSTFSAHVKRLKEFLSLAHSGSLVLIDEIGAGTDPSEGSALALAALEVLREKGAVTAVTTHLNLLKAHAQVNPAYLNASVEFDEQTLKPLYRLRYGVPGPSLGLQIAEGLGIPAVIIERARAHIREKEGAFVVSVRKIEEEKQELEKIKERLSILEGQRSKAVERLRSDRAELLKRAREKADSVLEAARREIKEAVERLREEGATRTAQRLDKVRSSTLEKLGRKPVEYRPRAGDKAAIVDSGAKGVVVRVDEAEKKAELLVGNIKVWVDWAKLEKRGAEKNSAWKAGKGGQADTAQEVAPSINVIGMRLDEALYAVEKHIDSAHAAGLDKVEIIHGVGTGALSKGIGDMLGGNRLVKRFYHADSRSGGGGVTIAELA